MHLEGENEKPTVRSSGKGIKPLLGGPTLVSFKGRGAPDSKERYLKRQPKKVINFQAA